MKLTIFKKIFLGYVIIILSVVGISFTVIIKLMPQAQSEFRSLPLAQYIETIYSTELRAAQKYFESRQTVDDRKFILTTAHFRKSLDSLYRMNEQEEIQQRIKIVLDNHQKLEDFFNLQRQKIETDRNYDPISVLQEKNVLIDSLHQQIREINEAYLPYIAEALRKYNQQITNPYYIWLIVLLLILVILIVVAMQFTRDLTKPITALQLGTQKVGEGQYETVPITSSDEIADLTRAFNHMSNQLKQLDELRMQMMSEISHEMRTPLQVIKAGCYTIIHAKDGPQLTQRQRDAVGMIHQATNRINSFVNSFLDIAKMEAGLMKFNFEINDIVELLSPLVHEAHLIGQTRQINVEFSADSFPKMKIDKERMSQAVSNLLSNALKYTPENGIINVKLTKLADADGIKNDGKGFIKIDVKDSGVGIPEADLKKLFTKFYQAKNTPLVNEKGSGLGLALVKHVSEAHGGKASVQSKVGSGSTFTIIFPISTE